jgi:hypothetical protein
VLDSAQSVTGDGISVSPVPAVGENLLLVTEAYVRVDATLVVESSSSSPISITSAEMGAAGIEALDVGEETATSGSTDERHQPEEELVHCALLSLNTFGYP